MKKNVHCVISATVLGATLLFAQSPLSASNGPQTPRIQRDTLVNKSFQFSWSSDKGHGVNGVATLKANGVIEGIASPNESTWLIDPSGRLIFKHADGRVSTRYVKVGMADGLLHFEGPFLFRKGIIHRLVELKDQVLEPENQITDELAARIKYSTQRFVCLDPGESYTFHLKDGTAKRITLVSVREYEDSVIHLTRRAIVMIDIDGKPTELTCAPYVMPTETHGLRIQADTTSAWLDMPKRVQFSIWDPADPIIDTDLFCFPLPAYRLFSHGMQAYNEPVHLGHRDGDPGGQRFYHNYGVDLAGYEGRQKVVSCIAGKVVRVDREQGTLRIQDERGFAISYGHLDSVVAGIRTGSAVAKGQWVGMLGRRGASGNFAHLHVGAYLSDADMAADRSARNLNLYPWLVAAYLKENPSDLLAVAGPHKAALTGEKVRFDGANSIWPKSDIISFKWQFHDGTFTDGPVAEKVYDKPGCYIASLWVKDAAGNCDVDFCRVRVYSRSTPEDVIATLFATCLPAADVRVDEPVNFRIWPQGKEADDIQIDFGDGAIIRDYPPYSAITHKFKDPGLYIVTVSGTANELPITQKVKVIVAK